MDSCRLCLAVSQPTTLNTSHARACVQVTFRWLSLSENMKIDDAKAYAIWLAALSVSTAGFFLSFSFFFFFFCACRALQQFVDNPANANKVCATIYVDGVAKDSQNRVVTLVSQSKLQGFSKQSGAARPDASTQR